jgi:cytochrome c peroxidase
MKRSGSLSPGHCIRALVAVVILLTLVSGVDSFLGPERAGATSSELQDTIPNNHPERNPGGKAATFSTQGSIDLTGEYFQAQGTNGRSCASCHIPEEAWSINPGTLQHLFDETNGTHPIFNELDANNPDELTPDSSVEERLAG